MKLLLFSFLSLLVLTSLASAALNIDKGKLNFDLNTEEESCQIVTLNSDDYSGEISIRNVWAQTSNEQSNLNSYNFTAQDHSLTISHLDTLLGFETSVDFEVCISGEIAGKYKGALIFTPESESNVVVEVGTWLLVTIQQPQTQQQHTGGGGGGGGGSSKKTTALNTSENNNSQEQNIELLTSPSNKEESETTDEPQPQYTNIAENKTTKLKIIKDLIPMIFIISIIALTIYTKTKKRISPIKSSKQPLNKTNLTKSNEKE